MENLLYLLKLKEETLKLYLFNYLKEKNMSPVFEDGFVYAKGDIPIMLVAHMDTIFNKPPKRLSYRQKEDKIHSFFSGIGGDDRCGIYAIMKLLEKFKPYVLFTEDEEIGCIGAKKAVDKLEKPNVKYIIEFDRRGSNDCVFYDCGNKEFIDYIESFGFDTDYGSFSDISVLGRKWDIASVNLSSGYYNEHTEDEYIIFHELKHNITRVEKMLREYEKAKYFNYQEIKYTPKNYTDEYSFLHDMTDEEWLTLFNQFYEKYKEIANNVEKEKKLTLRKDKKFNNMGNFNENE